MTQTPREAKIYRPTKNAMQSGKGGSALTWRLDFDAAPHSVSVEPLMGWTSSNDTTQQLRLSFASKEEAIAYAEKKKIPYRLIEPNRAKTRIQLYADNFKK